MDFSVTEEQREFCDCIVKFARAKLNEDCEQHDRDGVFPREKWDACAEMGLAALPFGEQYGGLGHDLLTTALSLEALGYACTDSGLVHALVSHIVCGLQIRDFGTDIQKQAYLPGICRGELIGAQAMTEAGAGSDAMGISTRAQKTGSGYLINGTKMFVSNGPVADYVLVFAVTDPERKRLGRISCFLVDKDGFRSGKPFEKTGLRTLQNSELVFEDCSVGHAGLLGEEGQGGIIFAEGMESERVLLFAPHVGVMARVLETTCGYARQRRQFDQPLSRFESVSNKIADMDVNLELARLILYKAASLKAAGKRVQRESAICKLFISESLKAACLDAVQIHGAYGYMTEYEVERALRDSIAASIYSGTSEIQRKIIARMKGC